MYKLGTQGVLADEYEKLGKQSQQLKQQRDALQNGSMPTLSEQIDQLQSMNESQVDATTKAVLSANDSDSSGMSSQALAFMPTSYKTGTTKANATMLVVFQRQQSQSAMGQAPDSIVNAQEGMKSIAKDEFSHNTIVFGSGLIGNEINQSMVDSLYIVGPLALVFVVLTLIIAYRDLLDILLGVLGIVFVLVWTFGAMGWAGITFNQMFIAVPVLLIGLAIDYAIHVFMRHREEREANPEEDVRGSMRVALVSVGGALTWVTATTVIGFLSNMVSPLPPIRDFGVVSSVGIIAALVIFGALIPALKVETRLVPRISRLRPSETGVRHRGRRPRQHPDARCDGERGKRRSSSSSSPCSSARRAVTGRRKWIRASRRPISSRTAHPIGRNSFRNRSNPATTRPRRTSPT